MNAWKKRPLSVPELRDYFNKCKKLKATIHSLFVYLKTITKCSFSFTKTIKKKAIYFKHNEY